MITAAHVVSSSALVALLVVPLAAWRATGDVAFALLVPFGLACLAVIEAIKKNATWSRRPAAARDCSLTCGGGRAGGAPGFPSGHVGVTTAVLLAVVFSVVCSQETTLGLSVVAAAWIGAMGWSRLTLECHDVSQVVGGFAFGVAAAAGFAACVRFYRHG